MNIKQILTFMNKYKYLVGFSDWKVLIAVDKDLKGKIAEICVNEVWRELEVEFDKSFNELSKEKQINTLIHELIHSRISFVNTRSEKWKSEKATKDLEEVDLVNVLTDGICSLLEEKNGNL